MHPSVGEAGPDGLSERISAAQGRLSSIYDLDLELRVEDFLISAKRARELLPAEGPRTGVLALQEAGILYMALYLDPADAADADAIVEETSHILCLAWHAARDWPVSRLHLELQGEVDRYAVARVSGSDIYPLAHFEDFDWADWMDTETLERYRTAHHVAHRYCRSLEARFPQRSDTPAWLSELRRFYRAGPEAKLRY
jgi:hypothetical protein